MNTSRFILTLSCKDIAGIVSEVSTFLFRHGGFITESAQFGDPSTQQFFMRTVFDVEGNDITTLKNSFLPIAEKFKMEWHLHDTAQKPRVLMMVSQQGHCLNDLLHRYASGSLPIEIPAVISNHPNMRKLVEWHEIPFIHLPVTPQTKMEQETEVWKNIKALEIDLVVLARYMQVLTPGLVAKLPGRAINIHHSFLPSFKGAKPYHQAYDRGVKIIGATAHYVSNDLDEGPIVEQEVISVDHTRSPEQLVAMGGDIESRVLARAVRYHIEQRVLINGNKTVVFK
ncbi:MAG: Formyltetrahydrofolate hydrolase [Rickettsiales bacterium]|jgi:formyltetrahydrofolate deformylase|nr:Formyltetrahydrofolate hydrolase [Rickettsiales bacterium]